MQEPPISSDSAPSDAEGPAITAASSNGDEAAIRTGYTVHLDEFDGPLDLLLYLISRDEIDIYDIPIAHITKQYLDSMEQLDIFDLDKAGEFIVMASTLMRIKARFLLPVQRLGEEDEDGVDPRDELVRRLLEYKKYKEAAQALASKEGERSEFFGRGGEYAFLDEAQEEAPELSLSLFDLLKAVRTVLDEMRGENVHHVYTEVYTVDGQEQLILERLDSIERVRFEELFRGMSVKMEVIVTFIAILDLLKSHRIGAAQSSSYGDIWIERREPSPDDHEDDDLTGLSPSTDEDDPPEEGSPTHEA